MAFFEIISEISEVEVIATGKSIRDLPRLRKYRAIDVGERWRELLSSNSEMDEFIKLNFIDMKRMVWVEKNINVSAIWNKVWKSQNLLLDL